MSFSQPPVAAPALDVLDGLLVVGAISKAAR
jgi:hypothetical protein